MSKKRTAVEKRDSPCQAAVTTLTEQKGPAFPPGRMLISCPQDIQRVVQAIPLGRVMTLAQLRTHLADAANADYTCPVTTGIFLRIVAEAAEEEGRTDVPYWRVVATDGKLNDKLPGGIAGLLRKLEAEGVTFNTQRKHAVVSPLAEQCWQP